MDDERIIELYWQRNESALTETARKYGSAMYSVSFNILKNRWDAEECVNDAYIGTWKAIPPTRPVSLYAFVCRIVRNRSINRYKALLAKKRYSGENLPFEDLAESLAAEGSMSDELEEKELADILGEWLSRQRKLNRYIFIRRFWFADPAEVIAKKAKLSKSAVYSRIDRMKKDLLAFLTERGVLL